MHNVEQKYFPSNLDNFEKTFFGFNTNGKGVECKEGQFVYSSDPANYDVRKLINLE